MSTLEALILQVNIRLAECQRRLDEVLRQYDMHRSILATEARTANHINPLRADDIERRLDRDMARQAELITRSIKSRPEIVL